MSSPHILLHAPRLSGDPLSIPYVSHPPPSEGRRLPNGTIIVTDEATPDVIYKLSPWRTAALAANEIDVCARLQGAAQESDGTVRLRGVGGTADHLIRMMERADRGPLDRFLIEQTRGDWRRVEADAVRPLLAQIAAAMAHMHAPDLVHRDLKAENILVFSDTDGGSGNGGAAFGVKAKVSDFDRAVVLAQGSQLEEPVGSLFHMAPELLGWKPYDRKVDVYAFGILMFEVLHGGSRAYSNVATCMPGSISAAYFASKVVDEGFRPEWQHGDEALKQLAARCWSADADDRPAFSEIVQLLNASAPDGGEDGDGGNVSVVHPAPELVLWSAADVIDGVGIASSIGKVRLAMEDAACVLHTGDAVIAGVFDGMRGARTSGFVARSLPVMLADGIRDGATDVQAALANAFANVDARLRELDPPITCGSTAVVAVVQPQTLSIAWVGDSPAYLFRACNNESGFTAVPLVNRHQPSREDEAGRVQAAGGRIGREERWLDNGETIPHGPVRVYAPDVDAKSGIALSRALGLFAYRPVIGHEPEVVQVARQADDRFVVLGSDGVFDLLDADAVYALAAAAASPQDAADAIVQAVLERGAPDNASVVVIDLVAR
ncbi:protein kinase [Hyphomicrobium sp. D-2]|uniref:protein kinase domain-containing protein n=1 Tax=Hyphomicrobium sp. D-2 TaxID=3041621 RepID=UPI002455531A|nr:protein kinase [Hyphomicrobium sp. D-2]MDH4980777.1 protein kinase [Hyphomicrobium sp. D-2]